MKKNYMSVWVVYILIVSVIWFLMIVLKALGIIRMSWLVVLSGIF